MSNHRPGFFARLHSLMRGFLSVWIRDREHESPEVVYEQAIAERVRQYRELKNAVAGVLYMRTKLEGEILERRAEIARMHDDVRRAVRRGRDEPALGLIQHKQSLFEELERAEQELEVVRGQADEAKDNLVRFREEIRSLVREKGHMLATLANATARRRLQVAIEGLSVDTEMDALENVREHISRISMDAQLSREIGDLGEVDGGMRQQLREFRDEARVESARHELQSLKREMGGNALPSDAETTPEQAAADRAMALA